MSDKIKIGILLFFICTMGNSQNFYVSPSGSDSNSGTSTGAAFKTINRAKEKAREIIAVGMTQDININIMSGEYVLNQTLEFTALDSGHGAYYVNYKAYDPGMPKPIISGGVKVTGWAIHDQSRNIWKANIGELYSRQLYINKKRAVRARTQNANGVLETALGYFYTCNDLDFVNMQNIKDVEVVSNIHFRNNRIPVKSVCGKQIVIDTEFWKRIHNQKTFEKAPADWIENSLAFLDAEQEWYIDKQSNTLYLKPSNSVTTLAAVNNLDVVIPKLEKLITGENVRNIRFKDVVFCYSTWNKPSEFNVNRDSNFGFFANQADDLLDENGVHNVLPASVSFINSHGLVFQNNVFEHIGSTGLSIGISSRNSIICNNQFLDISGSALHVGDINNAQNPCLSPNLDIDYYNSTCLPNDYSYLLVADSYINNNYINNVANEYSGCVAILVSFARNTVIKHNTISGFPYTGISVGWGWNNKIENGVNEIAYNKIDCSSQTMADGGGIYTLSSLGSNNNRSSVHHNYILNQTINLGAIYLDQGSSNVNIYDNLIDIQPGVVIPESIDCIDNGKNGNVRGIMCYNNSVNVTVERNLYNKRYNDPLLSGECWSCSNIVYDQNSNFVNFFETHSIIDGAGQQSSNICN
ncbi:hypothetical protein [Flavobacterium sp. UBA4197]|uniref:hypothetical protein n=1 Tax=Flavobacterium sp. UBA4197 TaxID=1946546 RepID=UPI00257FD28C|nr:hypothetical protein [Flavobacterium sp. UBA4197]